MSAASSAARPAAGQASQPPAPSAATKKPRGNPNLHLAARCGARTRAGCPCRAPAIHGKLRCRMHGGRSTGPRTPEGRARIAAARTTHGRYDAEHRAFDRHHVCFMRRSQVRLAAILLGDRLPPEFAARLTPLPPELLSPPRPTSGLSRAEDRALQQAEVAALAPWQQAIAQARAASRRKPQADPIGRIAASAATEPHAPIADGTRAHPARTLQTNRAAKPRAPESSARAGATLASPAATVPAGPAAIADVTGLTKPLAPEHSTGAAGQAASMARQTVPASTAQPAAEPHAPIPAGTAPAATPAPAGTKLGMNRAARRRWERRQRLQQKQAARRRP